MKDHLITIGALIVSALVAWVISLLEPLPADADEDEQCGNAW